MTPLNPSKRHRVGKRILLPFLPLRHFCIFVIFGFSSFLHFYTSAGQTCIAVVSKSKIDEEKLSSGTNDDYPDLSNHVGIGTLRYCHHHKPLLYSKNFAKLFSTQRHASSCRDVLGLCDIRALRLCEIMILSLENRFYKTEVRGANL